MDTDGDGQISYNEFLVATSNHRSMENTENLKNLFEKIDPDGNGVISTDELKATFSSQQDEKVWELLIAEVDKNGDGVISPEEFRQMMEEIIKKEVVGD